MLTGLELFLSILIVLAASTVIGTVGFGFGLVAVPVLLLYLEPQQTVVVSISLIGIMMAMKDDQGEPMSISATGLVCIVPTLMYLTALEAINATIISSTSNVVAGAARIVGFPWLTDQSKWYLLKTDGAIRPLIFQDREPVEFNALTEDSDEGFRREKFLYGVRARYRLAYGYWQFAVRMNFVAPV